MADNKVHFEKLICGSVEELLNMRLSKQTTVKNGKPENSFCETIKDDLILALKEIGYDVELLRREFSLVQGRCDFVAKTTDGEYIICEAKIKYEKHTVDYKLTLSYAIGQLLTYKFIFCSQYNVPAEKVHLCLLGDEDSDIAVQTILFHDLDIKLMIFGEEGVKIYGTDGQTEKGH